MMNCAVRPKRAAPSSSSQTENSENCKCIAPFTRKSTTPFVFDSQHDDEEQDESIVTTKLLSSKLNQMSLEERSNGLFDLHGVSSDQKIVETPEMIKSKISEMTTVLNDIASRGAQDSLALRKALFKSPKYVQSLKLRFLRTDKFRVKSAAERMVRYLSEQMKYFGEDKIYREIRFGDLGKEEVEALERGVIQVFPVRDQAGRNVLLYYGKPNLDYSTETVGRVIFYFITSVFSDEESQRNGEVVIYYGIGQDRTIPGRTSAMYSLYSVLPIAHQGGHCLQDSSAIVANHLIWIKLMESGPLSSLRFHFGSPMECIYILMTFGISRDAIPFREDGTFDLTEHHRILEILKNREKQKQLLSNVAIPTVAPDYPKSAHHSSSTTITDSSSSSDSGTGDDNVVLVPGPMDILLGRGRHQQQKPGMMKLNYLLEEYFDRYEAASKFDKTVLAGVILELLKESKCRFLHPVCDGFIECDEVTAQKKIAHSFRSLRKKKHKNGGGGDCATTALDE